MALELYRKKRNFGITPEPKGKAVKRKAKELSFVIQKHAREPPALRLPPRARTACC